MTSRAVVLVIVLLLLGAVPAGIAGVGGSSTPAGSEAGGTEPPVETAVSDGSSAAITDEDDILHRTTELRQLPDRPGEFEAEISVEVPAPISGLEIELEPEADVADAEGFEATDQGTYRWTETTDEPAIRLTMPANRTGDVGHHHDEHSDSNGTLESTAPAASTTTPAPTALEDGYTFVETGDWGVVQVPDARLSYKKPASVAIGVEETVTVDGPGAAGSDMAVFGPVTEYERTVGGETIRLVVPDAADLQESPADILDSLGAASERLDVGSSSPEGVVIAVPSDVDWGPRGVQYGQSDAWVVADAGLSEPTNVWLHEYVHVRQGFANAGTGASAAWLVEAQADYYAGLLAYEQGLVSFDEFSRLLERGERSPYADGVLADPGSWDHERTDYAKGALVYGELDRQLRLATDGDRTLDDVFRTLNAQDGQIGEREFLAALEAAGGEDVRATAERYTQTAATPDAWSRSEHRAAFDQSGPAVEYRLGSAPIEVAGEPWERWNRSERDGVDDRDAAGGTETESGDATADNGVLAVPAGEPVTVPVEIDNVGDRAGTADATLQIDGDIVDYRRTVLEAGESAAETFSWKPTEPGVYDVRIGSDRLTVFVRSTPSLTVTDLRVAPESANPGESVTATATVANEGPVPAAGTLEFRTAVATAAGQPIALAPGETGTVEATLSFDDEGRYEVTTGGQSATATVGGVLGQLDSVPGFGAAAAAAAVVVALGVVLAVTVLGRRG
ncbi:hypothetical protein GS429_05315 [Natronorubrum sp. JWXQ-INN-674]|uniref:CARDB domain-containing protein n=1 Tax=Natronorubrum halalkaliphilum TaxID=2691917 RepID=A0A6B0VI03_9EURY|nr:CARDB domain-containing protein [Natronorubrum halalkaliphilum]MXV61491.1 hypothetical protein [Natronorubrum halalkaliphilum]